MVTAVNNDTKKVVMNINPKNIIFNTINNNPASIVNFACVYIKQYIYRKRCAQESLNLQEAMYSFKNIQSIEKYIAVKNGHLEKYQSKWGPTDGEKYIDIQSFIQLYVEQM